MIVFQAQGGLGNQLFQYATARRLAMRHDTPVAVDDHWFDHPRPGETPRPLELGHYPVAMQRPTKRERSKWTVLRSRWARHMPSFALPLRLVKEYGHGVNAEVLTLPNDCYLSGFWQSEAYFSDIRDTLLRELTPITPPSDLDMLVMDRMRSTRSVSIHVRRGDYVTLASASAYHGLCTLDYYRRAIEAVAQQCGDLTLFIFSDDPEWTREHLRAPFPTHYVNHNPSSLAFQDLRLMSECQHHIIANSSFSWWGAWLSRSYDGIKIAPQRWYAADRPTPDLVPARWIRMPG